MQLSAGVYNREYDLSLYVPAVSSTIFGVVGSAHKGELNKIVEVGSQSEYVRKFGKPTTPMGRAMFQYLRYGNRGLIVRVANAAVYAETQIEDRFNAPTFTVKGKTPGEGFNDIKIYILPSAVGGNSKFKMVIEEEEFPVETWDNLDKFTLEDTINNATTGSNYIVVTNIPANPEPPLDGQTKVLLGGDSGIQGLSDSDYIGTKTGMVSTGLQCFSNPEEVEVDMLAIPENSRSAVIVALMDMVSTRGSGYAIVDPPYGLDVDEVIDFSNGAGNWNGQHPALNNHRACLNWPWHKVYDSYTESEIWIAPSGIVASLIAYNDYVAYPWIAAAGLERAVCTSSLAIEYSPSLDERHKLNAYNKVNPFVNFKSDGIVRWGSDTLYRKPSALGAENVRRMLFYAEKQLTRVIRYLNFNPNDSKTWREAISLANSVLDPIKDKGGLYDYRVLCDATTNPPEQIDQETMAVKILLKPTRIAKIINLDWTLLRTGAKFEEYV